MGWSFPSVQFPVEVQYTQTLGMTPDVAVLRILPQVANIPAEGTLTLTWGATTITLPNCVVDLGSVRVQPRGKHLILLVKDRRERWKMAAPISGEYNTIRVGNRLREKNLRELARILFDALGETSAVVSALPTTEYPYVSWECDSIVEILEEMLAEYGYSVSLGFDSEPVTVVQLGAGLTLSTDDLFVGSDTLDPKIVPRYVRSCFQHSVAQVRLKLEAVGYEPSTRTWKLIDDLSYKPAGGWSLVSPLSLPDLFPQNDFLYYASFVRRAYRVKGFADGTWNPPDESEELSGLGDILPLFNRVLETEDLRPDESYQPFRVYGVMQIEEKQKGNPAVPLVYVTEPCDEITGRQIDFDGENGIIIFKEPAFYVGEGAYQPANLWLECTIRMRNQTNFQWNHYEKDIEVDPAGDGYVTVKQEERAETIVSYACSVSYGNHYVTGFVTNQTTLDTIAQNTALAVIGTYETTASQQRVYSVPKLTLRCDGAIVQITHVLTEGEREQAVNRTSAARFAETDRNVFSRAERLAHLQALTTGRKHKGHSGSLKRRSDVND